MSDTTIATLVTMVQTLPDGIQDRIVELVREYITTIQDEMRWTAQFENSQNNLIHAARKAKREIAEGLAVDFDYHRL